MLQTNYYRLRKDADVQVDRWNRIIKYQAKDGTLSLGGDHTLSAKQKLGWVTRKKKIAARAEHDEVTESDEKIKAERKKMKATKRKRAEKENGKR